MKINKSISEDDKIIRYCMENLKLGNFRYMTYIDVHESDVEIYKDFLSDYDVLGQQYFFMYFETDKEHKLLCGCSSFKIKSLYDSTALEIPYDAMDEDDIRKIIAEWVKNCSHFYISGIIDRLFEKMFNA